MATILLQAAGAYIGGMLGTVGAAIGTAAGAVTGYMIDRALISGTQRIEGPRLTGARPLTAEEGAILPRLYGTARLGGILIWATRFQEVSQTSRQGKFGPKVTEYSYFANAAFALCEGPVAGIRRVWADGKELDLNGLDLRLYTGAAGQQPDPLIEATQGMANTPAYRDTAYVVIDNLDVGAFGNRLPQMQFEVMRPVGSLHAGLKAVCLIPGATEYGLGTSIVDKRVGPGEAEAMNRHVLFAGSDIEASLDELQMLCPALEHVALVVSWFGDDLRAGACRVRPAVTTRAGDFSTGWRVDGVSRADAMLVSSHGGGPAYGGTPSDRSVIEAIAEIKRRGLKVTLYPFMMLDIPAGNALPDPYGGSAQPPYPWRGRITCDPAPGRAGTGDRTAVARAEVEAFCGGAEASQFSVVADGVVYSGSASDWGYRRFVLHHAHLAQAAGGVDAFLIGTELRGLTTLRDQTDAFPFVEAMCRLAGDVRGVVGGATKLTYGADWSEYFGHHPGDGSGDVFFHLDPLWSHPEIDAIGIDNYMPLSDWRDEDWAGGNPDGFTSPYDPDGLASAVAGGEGYDWYYANLSERAARQRTPISDGGYSKPWVFRYKDMVNWWSNPHFDRPGGHEKATPTAWQPRSKPIWFTELGCPAVDKGPNQPNVFPDPKSVENALPYFSSGGRNDDAARRFLTAHLRHWSSQAAAGNNPVSDIYGGPMVDADRIYAWAWDARPFPAFPQNGNAWADAANWHLGHWLTGRMSAVAVADIINAVLADHGLAAAASGAVEGTLQGYVVQEVISARAALEPLRELFDLATVETPDGFTFRQIGTAGVPTVVSELVVPENGPAVEATRTAGTDMPAEAVLSFRDPMKAYQAGSARSNRRGAAGSQAQLVLPGVAEAEQAAALAEDWLGRQITRREQIAFSVAGPADDLAVGALVCLPERYGDRSFLVTQVDDGVTRAVQAMEIVRAAPASWSSAADNREKAPPILAGQPYPVFLDLPMGVYEGAEREQFRLAIRHRPWRAQAVMASPDTSGFGPRGIVARMAALGRLHQPLPRASFSGRIDRAGSAMVAMFDTSLESVSFPRLLAGENRLAVRALNGEWEILQFQTVEAEAAGLWRLTGLLRGQLGTEDAMGAGAAAGADVVLLDQATMPAGLREGEAGLELNWRIGPAGMPVNGMHFITTPQIGGLRAKMPLSPVHLAGRRLADGGMVFGWVRRGRIDADNWTAAEIPLGEAIELYRVAVLDAAGMEKRAVDVTTPSWTYTTSAMAADFPMGASIRLSVTQWSDAAGWGRPALFSFFR